ncbi:hypothetical protein LOZ43_006283 [Ophidiomyces ophidiicola]|nr:hypothetical protein LOZ43_006283 [Ophidiomyces ophidiicola]
MKIFLQIFNYQKAWTATNFEDFGSLYYIDDVNETMRRSTKPVFDKFVVGPAAGREWVDHGRSKLQCDRGPWRSLQEYRQATGLREKSAIKTFSDTPVPKQLTMLYGPDLYQPTLKKRLEAAESYLQLLSLLLPTDSALTSGHIWHNDLHGENIFVSQNMPTQVIGIIDWQSIQIAPLFDHCMDPTFLEYSGTPIGDSLKRPELPDTKSMSKDERDLAIKHYLDMSVMVAWRMLVKKKNPAQYRAILFEFTTEGYLLHLSRRLYELGEAYFSALLLDLCTERGNENFPLVFSEERKLEIEGDREAAQLSSEAMRDLERRLDGLWPEKALIEHENYDEVKSRLREVKEELAVLGQTRHLVPSTVLVDRNVYFSKPWVSGRVHGYHELQSYRKILAGTEASLLPANARICRLHGLIIDNDIDVHQHYPLDYPLDSNEEDHPGTRLVGLLLTNIENKGTLKELAPWSDCANNDRLCWSRPIHQSVEQLHNADVVWGDAKPENVLIDTKGDAWLIDFGGSYTPGWIDKDKRETVEGDWQGVQRIDEWLTKYSRKPVARINKLIEKEQ